MLNYNLRFNKYNLCSQQLFLNNRLKNLIFTLKINVLCILKRTNMTLYPYMVVTIVGK